MNKSDVIFWGVFIVLTLIIFLCDKYFHMLRDVSDAVHKPFSYSRVQLAWWTLIVMSSFVSIYFFTGQIPDFNTSSLILLGISAGTTTTASLIDASDQGKGIKLSQDSDGKNFFLDILSDQNGVSIHRLQTVLFNLIIGAWFIEQVSHGMNGLSAAMALCATKADALALCKTSALNQIMPVLSENNLILLGVSAGTYAALKTNENKEGMKSGVNNVPAAPLATSAAAHTAAAAPAAPVTIIETHIDNTGGQAK